MANNNGHWYTDKNGNHYFVENGQSPKEGWEASKRRKMIDGGYIKFLKMETNIKMSVKMNTINTKQMNQILI